MPTIELTINGQTKRVEVGEGATPADIDEIANSLSGGGEPAAAPPSSEPENAPTAGGRAQQQIEHIGRGYIDAARRIGSEMFPNWVTAPEGTPEPKDRTMLSRLGDLALVTSPVVAPELMLAGSGVSVASRALGAPQWLSDALGVGTELLTGGAQTVNAVQKAIRAPGQAAEAARAAQAAAEAERTATGVENVARGVSEAGEAAPIARGTAAAEGAAGISEAAKTGQAVTGNIGKGISEAGETLQQQGGARAAQGAAGISDAAATKQAADDIERLQTAAPGKAGTTLRETYPGAESARRSAFQEGTYDKIAMYAEKNGLNATSENAVGQKLVKDIQAAEDEWGELARSAEHKQVNKIMDKLQPQTERTGIIDPATGKEITRAGAPGTVTWKELDDAEKALQRVSGPSSIRKAIADAKAGLLEGTPAAKALESANQQWKLTIRPAKIIAAKLTKAESPVDAFRAVVGTGQNPQRLDFVRKVLVTGGHPEEWSTVVGGFFTDLAQRAKGDPAKMAQLWEGVRPGVRAVVDPDGVAAKAFEDFTKAGTREAAPLPELPTIPERGLPTPRTVEPPRLPPVEEGRFLPEMPPPVAAPSAGSRFKQVAQGGAYAFGVGRAAQKFYHGDWWGGLKDLGIGAALANPQIAASAAVPLARTGAAVVGSPGGQEAIKAYDKFLTQPSDIEQSGTSSEAPPAPTPQDLSAAEPKAQGPTIAASPAQKETASFQPSPGFHDEIRAVSNVVGVPANLVRSVIHNESGGDPTILSRETVGGVHARGIMQIMPSTFEGYRKRIEAITGREANIDDPLDNLVAGALHLKDDLAASGGDIAMTARRYTGGPDARRWGPKTEWYGNKVARDYAMMERG